MNSYEKALKKIEHDQKCKPNCTIIINSNNVAGPTGPTGPQGLQGATGPTGPVPTFEIGTVETGAPGTDASVTITEV